MGLEGSDDIACGGGGGVGCFPLDTDGVETYLASKEGCLKI
jgi:hypothetical protein